MFPAQVDEIIEEEEEIEGEWGGGLFAIRFVWVLSQTTWLSIQLRVCGLVLTRGSIGMYSPGVNTGSTTAAIDRTTMRAQTSLMSVAESDGSVVSTGDNVKVQSGYKSR